MGGSEPVWAPIYSVTRHWRILFPPSLPEQAVSPSASVLVMRQSIGVKEENITSISIHFYIIPLGDHLDEFYRSTDTLVWSCMYKIYK